MLILDGEAQAVKVDARANVQDFFTRAHVYSEKVLGTVMIRKFIRHVFVPLRYFRRMFYESKLGLNVDTHELVGWPIN
jgi:hypothetical protein